MKIWFNPHTPLKESNMAESSILIFTIASMFISVHCVEQPIMENKDFVSNFSYQSLGAVPENLTLQTTVLDLSHNNIQKLQATNFNYLLHLRVLNISYNAVIELDRQLFDDNKLLEHLDLSNNKLENVSCTFPDTLRHLDISYNHFRTLSVCRGLTNLVQLEHLGLGAEIIRRSDLSSISHLKLQNVFLNLDNLREYENGSLLMLNTSKLHLSSLSMQNYTISILFDAVNTSEFLELSNFDTWQERMKDYIKVIAYNSRVTHLTMSNLSLRWDILTYVLQVIWHSPVERFELSDFTLLGVILRAPFNYSHSSMKELYVTRVQCKVFIFDQTILYRLFSEMNIENLTITSANFLFMECPLKPSNFQHIDFSSNAMTDDVFQNCANLTKLKTLKMADNKLQKLARVSSMTNKMSSLQYLDVSRNQLDYSEEECNWSQSLRKLDLSSCSLGDSVFKCLPKNITWLNLAKNDISLVPLNMTYFDKLEYLNLAYNRFFDLPDCSLFPGLMVLNVAHNQIPYPTTEFLHKCLRLTYLDIGQNPFHCFCEIRKFIGEAKRSTKKVIGWPNNYVCDRPDNLEGVVLLDVYIPEIYCNIFILVPVIVVPVIVGLALLFWVCKYCDVLWYLKMIWQWTKSKHRSRRSKSGYWELDKDFDFHAFVSYSEHDASWVKNVMLPSIESMDNSIRICQHERNFVPGKPIVENIINSIERSYKSIFILSPHFVQSEWCHYELYFAHQQLLTEKKDNLILILLEPIPQYIIPSKYSKLKALMTKRTYLEWPKDRNKHTLFWANVKAAISIKLSDLHHEIPQSEYISEQSTSEPEA
ncbi:toll-like receptor 6 [Hyperolius riggenbachi]|uniref:toll-like receptor 6 n=1 Tax=Hyperolius riggenbachi TaxID=752182 RepID=UPI0035A288B4